MAGGHLTVADGFDTHWLSLFSNYLSVYLNILLDIFYLYI